MGYTASDAKMLADYEIIHGKAKAENFAANNVKKAKGSSSNYTIDADGNVKKIESGYKAKGGSQANTTKTYYHVTTREAADQIISSGELKNGKFESSVFAWNQQPTKAQAKRAGLGNKTDVVLKFETNASFSPDYGVDVSLQKYAVRSSEGTRLPIKISNVSEVGFKKKRWKFW